MLAQLPVCLSFSRPSVSYLLPNSIHLSLIFPKVNIFLFRISLCLFFKFLLPLSLKALTYSIEYSVSACCLLQSSGCTLSTQFFFCRVYKLASATLMNITKLSNFNPSRLRPSKSPREQLPSLSSHSFSS